MDDAVNDAREASDSTFMRGIQELLDVEALAQMVEDLSYRKKLSQRVERAVSSLRRQAAEHSDAMSQLQRELRSALMDIELLKRASVSSGHVGVLTKQRVEKELVRALFPPTEPRNALGVKVNTTVRPSAQVDCASRLHLCKAACCRIFNVHLTAAEVDSGRFEWDPNEPYSLARNRVGCQYLRPGGCECRVYENRPATCTGYDCRTDHRIWKDFERFELDPSLAKRLETLEVATSTANAAATSSAAPATAQRGSSNGAAPSQAPTPPTNDQVLTPVSPPDFSELKLRMPALPTRRFVPPSSSQPPSHVEPDHSK